jgi:RecG-like helicase
VALRKLVDKLTKPVEELDRQELDAWRAGLDVVPLDEVEARRHATVAGEVRSVRIVPRAGADALEVTIVDGRGVLTAVFLGRRRIGGIVPGRRILLEGMVGTEEGRAVIYNPTYTLA